MYETLSDRRGETNTYLNLVVWDVTDESEDDGVWLYS